MTSSAEEITSNWSHVQQFVFLPFTSLPTGGAVALTAVVTWDLQDHVLPGRLMDKCELEPIRLIWMKPETKQEQTNCSGEKTWSGQLTWTSGCHCCCGGGPLPANRSCWRMRSIRCLGRMKHVFEQLKKGISQSLLETDWRIMSLTSDRESVQTNNIITLSASHESVTEPLRSSSPHTFKPNVYI